MRRDTFQGALLLAMASLFAQTAQASLLPAGTPITGLASGAADALLGYDGLQTYAGNASLVYADDIEFVTSDTFLAIDFTTDGSVTVWNNSDSAALTGSYTLSFSFAGLVEPITGFSVTQQGDLLSGDLAPALVNGHEVQISFSNLVFKDLYQSITLQISTTPAVPEPASWALFGAGLAGLTLVARRKVGAKA